MPDKFETGLAEMAGRLEAIDGSLRTLTAEIKGRIGALKEEDAEDLLDRLDEMMDLLYLMDDRLAAILAEVGAES